MDNPNRKPLVLRVQGIMLRTSNPNMSNKAATETFTREQNDGRRTDTIQDTEGMTSEFSTPIGNVFCRVGCWNVRTLYLTGKLAKVKGEMERYKIELLGISETT